jgi:tripartite-type tricarboxylate transporter receptor subunit TctC
MQTGKARVGALADVPTALESGFAAFESYAWWGVFTAGGTPKPIIERFRTALVETLREPVLNKQLVENMQITELLAGPEEQRKFLVEQMKQWGPIVREHGIVGE